jgi:hypothetical protein
MHFRIPRALHGWSDFGREVTIVVIGVLIALGLEQLVDHQNWRSKIDRAEGAMRLELTEDDGPQAYVRLAIAPCLDSQIAQLHDSAGRLPPSRLQQMASAYSPPFRTWESQAWQAALNSDVGSHVRSDKLVHWSEPYLLIASMTQWNQREYDLVTDLREALPQSGAPSAAELQELRHDAAELRSLNTELSAAARLLLDAMRQNGFSIPQSSARQLLSEARTRYGGCVRDPALSHPFELTQFSNEEDIRRSVLGTK